MKPSNEVKAGCENIGIIPIRRYITNAITYIIGECESVFLPPLYKFITKIIISVIPLPLSVKVTNPQKKESQILRKKVIRITNLIPFIEQGFVVQFSF